MEDRNRLIDWRTTQPLLFEAPPPSNSVNDAAAIVRAKRAHADLVVKREKVLARHAFALRQVDYHERILAVDERLFERRERRARDLSRRRVKIAEWQRRAEGFAVEAEALAADADRLARETIAALAQPDIRRAIGAHPAPGDLTAADVAQEDE